MPELWYIWIMNVWRVRAFFYLQFKGPKSFGALNYSYIQMNLTLRTFFSFLLLFHEFRVYPSEGWGKIAKTVSSKGFWKGYFKRFQSTLGFFFARTWVLVHGCCFFYLFPHSWRCFWYSANIILPSLSLLFWTSTCLSDFCPVCVCVSVSLLCLSMFSLLNALRSVQLILIGMTLPWEEMLECSQCIFIGWRLVFRVFETQTEHHK